MVARGDVVIVSLSGDYSKPRPALVIQGDMTLAVTGSVTFCLITSELIDNSQLRVDIASGPGTGLKVASQIQTDKIYTLPAGKVRGPIGNVDRAIQSQVDLALALHLDLMAP